MRVLLPNCWNPNKLKVLLTDHVKGWASATFGDVDEVKETLQKHFICSQWKELEDKFWCTDLSDEKVEKIANHIPPSVSVALGLLEALDEKKNVRRSFNIKLCLLKVRHWLRSFKRL